MSEVLPHSCKKKYYSGRTVTVNNSNIRFCEIAFPCSLSTLQFRYCRLHTCFLATFIIEEKYNLKTINILIINFFKSNFSLDLLVCSSIFAYCRNFLFFDWLIFLGYVAIRGCGNVRLPIHSFTTYPATG